MLVKVTFLVTFQLTLLVTFHLTFPLSFVVTLLMLALALENQNFMTTSVLTLLMINGAMLTSSGSSKKTSIVLFVVHCSSCTSHLFISYTIFYLYTGMLLGYIVTIVIFDLHSCSIGIKFDLNTHSILCIEYQL